MKKIIVFFALCLMPITALASPFLVCDLPSETIVSCEVEVTRAGATTAQPGICQVDGVDYKLLDLSGLPNGSYIFRARWTGTGGWPSDWSSPFDAVKPASGGALRIKK